jgi:hypothetical protein
MIVSPRKSPDDRSVFVFFSAAKMLTTGRFKSNFVNLTAKTAVAVTSVCGLGQAQETAIKSILTALFIIRFSAKGRIRAEIAPSGAFVTGGKSSNVAAIQPRGAFRIDRRIARC